jgi:ADP-ribose pyrophosphatase YjhB (NUDIX family)
MTDSLKRSMSLAIRDDAGRTLLVQRPPDDEDLPLAWGLPAASLRGDEDCEAAVRRAARAKLGVEIVVHGLLRSGHLDRPGYRLEMRLFGARITEGKPAVPQPADDVTQYVALRWGQPEDLLPAARAGSLCSRLYLEWSDARNPGASGDPPAPGASGASGDPPAPGASGDPHASGSPGGYSRRRI